MRILASVLLIFFLFTGIVMRSINAINPSQVTTKTLIAKKDAASSKADTQFLFDVKEGEERSENGCGNESADDLQNNFYFIGLINIPALFTTTKALPCSLCSSSHSFGNALGVPLYIAERSFLI